MKHKTLLVSKHQAFGRVRYKPLNNVAILIKELIQRNSKHDVMFTDSDILRIKQLGFKVAIEPTGVVEL